MPEDNVDLGKDLSNELESKKLYEDMDTKPNPDNDTIEGLMTLKYDFPSVNDFLGFVGRGAPWKGSKKEINWVSHLIYEKDSGIYKDRQLVVDYVNYKPSRFDGRPVVVVLVKYHQDI